MRWILKKLSTGEGPEEQLFFLGNVITWISKYITWISQQYSHFYAFYWFLMRNYWFSHNTCYKNRTPETWRFLSLQSLLLPQFSTYRHWTGFIVKRKQVHIQESIRQNNKLIYFILEIFKVVDFARKNKSISKNSIKFIIDFFSKTYNW